MIGNVVALTENRNLLASSALEHDRIPPHNYEAEQALLGPLLHNNQAYEKISDFLMAEHFANAANGRIYAVISKLIERGQIADPITLKSTFEQDNSLQEIGGTQYLAHLAASVVSIISVQHYGELIYDLHLRRQLIDLGEEVVNNAFTPDVEHGAQRQIESAEQRLYDLATVGQADRGFVPFSKALTESIQIAELAFKREDKIVGVTSGFKDLDGLLGGLHPSDLIILAGRPSMGKTALATNIAFNAAEAGLEQKIYGGIVAFFSLEMSSEQLATRLLAQESGVPSDRIRRGDIPQGDFQKFFEVSRRLANLPLYIDDTPGLTISALRTRARRLKRKHGLSMIVVDYLQLLQGSSGSRNSESRVQEISEITRGLKTLAKELNVPVIALSQLSRAVEQREDKRPQLADLRESGSIEQDADVVMFVYREEYYESRREPAPNSDKHAEWSTRMKEIYNLAEVIVAKQRHGPINNVKLFFDGALTKFGNYVESERMPQYGGR